MKRRTIAYACAASILLIAATAVFVRRDVPAPAETDAEEPSVLKEDEEEASPRPERRGAAPAEGRPATSDEADLLVAEDAEPDEQPDDSELEMTEEEKKEEEEERLVEEFDSTVDKWMETTEKGVAMADVDAFRESFRRVPKDRKEECLQRALNLVPDENVMLLAGILFDKTQDKELLDLVYNDILNRDEEVKKPVLQEIYKDKEHPNWADTAWILDVTGELPTARE